MASDEIINEIWEIAQENSINPIDKDEFGNDLKKAVFAELERSTEGVIFDINNEFARALPIILHQAKANPDLIYDNNGKGFSVASGILAKAVLTVKYENRFIPGTAEYKKEFPKESLPEIVIVGAVAELMIKNYDNLSYEERKALNNNWKNLTGEQRKDIIDKTRKQIRESKDLTEDEKTELDNVYAEVSGFEDAESTFEKMSPEQQAKFAATFLDKMGADDPKKLEQIKKLREIGLTDIEIRQMFVDNYMNLVQQANDTYLDFSNGNPDMKIPMMQRFRDLSDEVRKFRASSEYTFAKMGFETNKIGPFNYAKSSVIEVERRYEESFSIIEQDVTRKKLAAIAEKTNGDFGLMIIPDSPEAVKKNQTDYQNKKAKIDLSGKKEFSETKESREKNDLIEMIKDLSEDEVDGLMSYELIDLLSKKAEELGLSDKDKKILEAMIASKDDDSFADLFYDDRDGFIEELEKMSLLQHAKKQPVTDQEYGPTYRANAEEMVVDSKGLYKAQTDIKKINEQDGAGTGEGSDASTSGTAVVQNNDTLEVDTINTHQPATNSFINTARREGEEKDGKDLKGEKDGEGLEDVPPENDLPDNAPNNSVKVANVITITKKKKMTTDVIQEMGNITTTKVKEEDKQQGGPEVGDTSETIQPGEIE